MTPGTKLSAAACSCCCLSLCRLGCCWCAAAAHLPHSEWCVERPVWPQPRHQRLSG